MKVELELNKTIIAIVLIAFIVGLAVGNLFIGAKPLAEESPAVECLTKIDLNRQDLGNVVSLTRFCEGLGFASAVNWNEQDDKGNIYGSLVCMKPAP